MSKYSRHSSVVSRQSDEFISEDQWLKNFQKSLQKDAVQSREVDSSIFNQINSIMNSKSKYPSVAAAVEDMQARSGLTAYLDKVSKTKEEVKKVASPEDKSVRRQTKMPIVFEKCPQVKTTLNNYIRDTRGNLPVSAIIEKVRSIHQNDISDSNAWEDDNLIREVSRLNLIAKRDNPATYENYSNLGSRDLDSDSDVDSANTDAFHALIPYK